MAVPGQVVDEGRVAVEDVRIPARDAAIEGYLAIPTRPVPPLELVDQLRCPLYVVGGEEDENPSPATLRALEERLDAAGKDARVEIYGGAGHAFLADYRPSYREGPAFEVWPKIVRFFDEHLR